VKLYLHAFNHPSRALQLSALSMLEVPLYSPKSGARDTACPLLVIPPARDRLCTPCDARAIRAVGLVTLKPVAGGEPLCVSPC
jgi:hypothetical protein